MQMSCQCRQQLSLQVSGAQDLNCFLPSCKEHVVIIKNLLKFVLKWRRINYVICVTRNCQMNFHGSIVADNPIWHLKSGKNEIKPYMIIWGGSGHVQRLQVILEHLTFPNFTVNGFFSFLFLFFSLLLCFQTFHRCPRNLNS